MKAQENVQIWRTDGDTDPMIVRLIRRTDEGDVAVGNSATVEMNVRSGAGITIAGTARGDGSGTFLFEPDDLPAGSSRLPFDIDVDESGELATYARGRIDTAPKPF